jgi:hypothetical protein
MLKFIPNQSEKETLYNETLGSWLVAEPYLSSEGTLILIYDETTVNVVC